MRFVEFDQQLSMHVCLATRQRKRKDKEKTTLLNMIKERLMVNLSFSLAQANIKGGGGREGNKAPSRHDKVPGTLEDQ